MRPLAARLCLSLALTALVACSASPAEAPPPDRTASDARPPATVPSSSARPPAAVPASFSLTLPSRFSSGTSLSNVIFVASSEAPTAETELSYAIAPHVPDHVTIAIESGFVSKGCSFDKPGIAHWTAIAERHGDAASVEMINGSLSLDLHEEGTVELLLEGQLEGLSCAGVTAPLAVRHRLTLHVHPVAGLVVEQLDHWIRGCEGPLVMPTGAAWSPPTVRPLGASGKPFDAANAPVIAPLTLRSDEPLTLTGHQSMVASPGPVVLSVDSTLPVQGLDRIEVVGPSSLTSADVSLSLRQATLKETLHETLKPGASYQLFYPDMDNGVDARTASATTPLGALCADIPASWFASASETPDVCAAQVDGSSDPEPSFVSVASIRSTGECRLEVSVPGSGLSWSTRFTVAP